jgi:hypothetical protein
VFVTTHHESKSDGRIDGQAEESVANSSAELMGETAANPSAWKFSGR